MLAWPRAPKVAANPGEPGQLQCRGAWQPRATADPLEAMNESALLMESLWLLVMGMGIVYGFLLLLVGILRLMSATVRRLAPLETPTAAPVASPLPAGEPEDLLAVISAAVARYRQSHRS